MIIITHKITTFNFNNHNSTLINNRKFRISSTKKLKQETTLEISPNTWCASYGTSNAVTNAHKKFRTEITQVELSQNSAPKLILNLNLMARLFRPGIKSFFKRAISYMIFRWLMSANSQSLKFTQWQLTSRMGLL